MVMDEIIKYQPDRPADAGLSGFFSARFARIALIFHRIPRFSTVTKTKVVVDFDKTHEKYDFHCHDFSPLAGISSLVKADNYDGATFIELLTPLLSVQNNQIPRHENFHGVTDCSFLLFHRDLLHIYWDTILDRVPTRQSIDKFTMAISDCIRYTEKSRKPNQMNRFRDEMIESVKKGFLTPLCAAIENDLRVLSHQHLVVNERDKSPQENLDFYKKIMSEPEIRLYGLVLDAKDFVSCNLQKTFYDLTAVTLHDRHAYSKMAMLAKQRYGLDLIDGMLPNCCIGQSLDVVKVMRSLGEFVSDFNYCLNQQLFIEKTSPNRSLRVLTAEHMADSMRTHGLGVLNTSVNVTYQFLRSKFAVFNQFLRDEHIHAQLQKDIRYFRENLEALKKLYPPKRAEHFNKAFSQLTSQEGEPTYMDRFRMLVTQMGNALGFVRSMSSGAAAVASQMKAYDTIVDDIVISESDGDTPLQPLKELLTDLRDQANKNRDFTKASSF
ncbi:hypothetical protein Y032_0172g352 [Ancylostoma ceylanicum]|nr:hypothetical protein Y032_0172g352 [Ancylostoma ceylanicum]